MADCINTDFSYECKCKQGYFEDAGECFDADECVMKTHRRVKILGVFIGEFSVGVF